jgi:hypothetical protein
MRSLEDNISRFAIAHTKIGGEWVPLEQLTAEAGLTIAEMHEVVRELMTADEFRAEPQPFNFRITDWDRANAPVIGGEARHLISWE